MRSNFDRCLAEVLIHEGGFVDHPRDPGGMTNLGVTKAVYEEWIGYPVTESVMRKLTVGNVKALYKQRYWDVVKCDDLPTGLDMCVFDFAVNAGPKRAARYLQLMVGGIADGDVGPKTLASVAEYVKKHGPATAILRYQDLRRAYYPRLDTYPTFGRGWMRRVDKVEQFAVQMLAK